MTANATNTQEQSAARRRIRPLQFSLMGILVMVTGCVFIALLWSQQRRIDALERSVQELQKPPYEQRILSPQEQERLRRHLEELQYDDV